MADGKVLGSICFCAGLSLSLSSSDDGYAPGIFSGVVGCDVRGPPPGVGGSLMGVRGGAGISVPAVREMSTGVTVSAKGFSVILPFNVFAISAPRRSYGAQSVFSIGLLLA